MITSPSIKAVNKRLQKDVKAHATRLQTAGVRALNRTATSVRKISSDKVRETLNIKASFVKKLLFVQRAKRGKFSSKIAARYERVPVIAFNGVRATKKGVSVRMRKDKPRKLFSGAFIQRMKSGHVGVFRRSLNAKKWTDGRPRSSSPNLKITELKGTSVQAIFAEHLNEIILRGDPIFQKNISREIDFALRK